MYNMYIANRRFIFFRRIRRDRKKIKNALFGGSVSVIVNGRKFYGKVNAALCIYGNTDLPAVFPSKAEKTS